MRIEHWRYAVPLWLRGLLRRRDVERDLDDEIRNHIEHQTAANIAAGMRPDEARRAALVTFGGVERIKDESRDARRLSLVDSVGQLRHTVRSLWRARMFTVATVTTIALAIGAGCTVFTLVNTVLLRPLPRARTRVILRKRERSEARPKDRCRAKAVQKPWRESDPSVARRFARASSG